MPPYTFAAVVPGSIAELRPRVEAALKEEGFGVLTEIDVAATLKAKLDLDLPGYLILGACNPRLASRAIEIDPSIGALLPCNVVLREADGGGTVVEIVDPDAALGIAGAVELEPLAAEAAERLRRVLAVVAGPSVD
jgi:uncharacterized protein (DUF302 family)